MENRALSIREETQRIEREILSPYAALSENTRGRVREAAECPIRTPYQRDRDKVIHCKAFRRLKHKTQVFLSPEGDHYRTRLTHTLEVAQIARTIARALRLNEDLTEAVALGHDLGHTPFGHAGERALNRLMPNGFRHYEQSVRVVERLENDGRGLNLTFEVRDGIRCHTTGQEARTMEGRIIRWADKIAYMNHDIDDAIRAGVIRESDIPRDITAVLGDTKNKRITTMVTSLIRNSPAGVVGMDADVLEAYDALHEFMYEAVYLNDYAKREGKKGAAPDREPVRLLRAPPGPPARKHARDRGGGREGAGGVRLHRRHDGPLCRRSVQQSLYPEGLGHTGLRAF